MNSKRTIQSTVRKQVAAVPKRNVAPPRIVPMPVTSLYVFVIISSLISLTKCSPQPQPPKNRPIRLDIADARVKIEQLTQELENSKTIQQEKEKTIEAEQVKLIGLKEVLQKKMEQRAGLHLPCLFRNLLI